MYLYRLTYLNKKTGEEKDIAYFCGPIQGGSEKTGSDMSDTEKEYSYNKEWPHKLVIYDAFVKEDLSELKLLAGQHFDVSVIVFKLSDILQKPGKKEFYEIEYGKDYFKSSVSATGIGINEFCFLTPSVVSVSIRLIDRFGDKTYKYHVMPTIMEPNPKTGEHLYQKIMWCNNSCDYYTFDGLLFIYGFRKDGVSQKWPSNEEIDAFRKRKGFIGEPKYDMNEWDGWTRMNRDSSWLKD